MTNANIYPECAQWSRYSDADNGQSTERFWCTLPTGHQGDHRSVGAAHDKTWPRCDDDYCASVVVSGAE